MPAGLRHPDWYLIAEQRFRRRAGLREVTQRFRGQDYLVLWDGLTGQNLRLDGRAARLWHRLDGRLTADALWRALAANPADAPTQREMMDWVLQLVSAGLILSDHALDPSHLTDRSHRKRDQQIEARAANPLSVKIPLFDPSWLLNVTYPWVRWVFTPTGAIGLALLLTAALVAGILNWSALMQSADTNLLTQAGFVAIFLSYPVMKAIHEMAHGWCVHHYGGEVREAGVMLLLFVPVPYVDASAATAFANPRARMLVGAAGILAELAIAAVSLLLWLQIEPGVERAVLYSFVVMGTLSTLLFNGNPLLKFDAYYVLSDWMEIPNLATKAANHLSDLVLTRFLGLRPETLTPPDEAGRLLVYGVLSLIYRLSLMLAVVLVISRLFYVLGVVLAIWALIGGVAMPLFKLFRRAQRTAAAQNRKGRALGRFALVTVLVVGLGGFVPLPFAATGRGQIVPLAQAELRLGATGMVDIASPDGATVSAGQQVLSVTNPELVSRLQATRLRVTDLGERLQRGGMSLADRADLEAALQHARETLLDGEARDAARLLRVPMDGRISWLAGRPPVPGTFVQQGDLAGHVIAPKALQIELAFPAAFAGRLPVSGAEVVILLPDGTRMTQPLARFQVLDAGAEVPAALMVPNGGTVPAQPGQPTHALAPVLVGWVQPQGDVSAWAGMRVDARIELPPRSALYQMGFHLRRLFLRVTLV